MLIEKWDKSKTARKKSASKGVPENYHQEEAAQHIRQMVGISVFTESLKAKFGVANVHETEPKGITTIHAQCGGKNAREDKVCKKCGLRFDPGLNAAKNLYLKHFGVPDPVAAE